MRQLFSGADIQALSSLLAVVLLLSSVPLTSGVLIISGPTRPELTINICQPIQMFDRVSNNLLARPAVNPPQFVLLLLGSLAANPTARLAERDTAPDTPPPKTARLRAFSQQQIP